MVVLSSAKQVKCTTWCRNKKRQLFEGGLLHSSIFKSLALFKSPKQEALEEFGWAFQDRGTSNLPCEICRRPFDTSEETNDATGRD
jgi:hypothetical protein